MNRRDAIKTMAATALGAAGLPLVGTEAALAVEPVKSGDWLIGVDPGTEPMTVIVFQQLNQLQRRRGQRHAGKAIRPPRLCPDKATDRRDC